MTSAIRAATVQDIPQLVTLLMDDATDRQTTDPVLWRLADDARDRIAQALSFALTAEQQPVRQFWLVCERAGGIVGVVHAIMLPVPPIYAGSFGEPGLIMADSHTAPDAPAGTEDALVAAAETVLREAGAKILLSTYVTGQVWDRTFAQRGYAPLTLYLSRTDMGDAGRPQGLRAATAEDVPGIVAHSAANRRTLWQIEPFWEPHTDADARFGAWMTRSLTLRDRDMLVMGPPDDLAGYAIAQPASRTHFPSAHDISGTGVIDDFYHLDFADQDALKNGGAGAVRLLNGAEAAFAARGMGAAFVVCPAGWTAKIEMLEDAGYSTAMVWSIKR
ncbi:hypothetical protein ATO6_03075 [Oceanicola sp. 22II-s10i]|uniref:hypothetical protein n=1 Tax=Oceanicola sp. 22II-s10i TaxID=1317116 RepID=UPI000B521AF0|nr:hypothetical protein [Oceanicola sp. 22II-s10i]OWU85886.1 hypothetical protein ATO6_03075 [Oceanicola sp. 22II-s10i]